ncbi:MAG TPA: hypothetical protein VLH09_11525 [Bryobacteraceae bacterium]|nr:hypothetical protein [Bryobacteraceae bacterium]
MTSANLKRHIETADPGQSRKRLISFRLTEEEHAALRHLSTEQGAHSLSDFVRSRVCAILASRESWEDELAGANSDFARQAIGLHAVVERLAQLLKNIQGTQLGTS